MHAKRTGRPSATFKKLSAELKQLAPNEKLKYDIIGRTAKVAHRAGGVALGVVGRSLRAAIEQDEMRRFAPEAMQLVRAPAEVPTEPLATPLADLPIVLKRANAIGRASRKAKRRRADAAAAQLVKWMEGGGIRERNLLVHSAPHLAPHAVGLQGLLSSPELAIMRFTSRADLEVPRMTGLRLDRTVRSVVEPRLAQEWHQAHHVILHREQAPLASAPKLKKNGKPPCLEAGLCMRGSFGDKVWAVKSWLCTCLKKTFTGETLKKMLKSGPVVICVHISNAGEPLGEGQSPDAVVEADIVFVHVAMLYESPFRPTLRELERLPDEGSRIGDLRLRGTHVYHTLLQFVADRLLSHQAEQLCWHLEFYGILDSDRPLGKLDPREIETNALQQCAVHVRKFPLDPAGGRRNTDSTKDEWAAALKDIDAHSDPASSSGSSGDEDGVVYDEEDASDGDFSAASECSFALDDDAPATVAPDGVSLVGHVGGL